MTEKKNQTALRRRQRRGYQIDLADLHALCEVNYHRLMRLFPDYEQRSDWDFAVGDVTVALEVTARGRYTTDMRLRYHSATPRVWAGSYFDLRLYHDARMAEIVHCSTSRRFEARYRYPNPDMLQRDEKYQQNRFASELLSFCLTHGRSADTVLPDADTSAP
jgi:uncharacterized protein YqiB (DUF1249 family)